MKFATDEGQTEEVRVAAIEAVGRIRPPKTAEFLDGVIARATTSGVSTPLAEAAIRAWPEVRNANPQLLAMIAASDTPLGLRREALRTYARPKNGGGRRILELAKSGKLPDDLKSEATALVHNDPDGTVRRDADAILPAPKAASGRSLPPLRELAVRAGNPKHGRDVFFRPAATAAVACGACHRVQGQGQWVGPDLSTIGTKYGKEELFRSILYPSAAIGYNNKTHVLALADGRVLSGLVVEDSPDRIVLKTAEGKRVAIPPKEVEDHKISEVSLMPEGLAASMSDADFVDLVAYLATLRQPVSIVGQYQALGPVALGEGSALPSPKIPLPAAAGQTLAWRRLKGDAEGLVEVAPMAGLDPAAAVFLHVPMLVPGDLDARLVIDSSAPVQVYLDGRPVSLTRTETTQSAPLRLTGGEHDLTLRVAGGPTSSVLVTTLVTSQPVEFRAGDAPAVPER